MAKSMSLHEELIAVMGDAVVVCDAEGLITVWNPAAERMFGFTSAEACGQSLDIIIPERLRERHWEGYRKTMETGVTRYGSDVLQVPAIDKHGKSMSIAFTVALTHDDQGHVSSIVSVIREETERFARDRLQRKKLAELEEALKAATTKT